MSIVLQMSNSQRVVLHSDISEKFLRGAQNLECKSPCAVWTRAVACHGLFAGSLFSSLELDNVCGTTWRACKLVSQSVQCSVISV